MKPRLKCKKVRINITIDPTVLREIDYRAYDLGCSRSELIEYCYRLWAASNPVMGGTVVTNG